MLHFLYNAKFNANEGNQSTEVKSYLYIIFVYDNLDVEIDTFAYVKAKFVKALKILLVKPKDTFCIQTISIPIYDQSMQKANM